MSKRRFRYGKLLATLVLMAAAGCSATGPEDDDRQALQAARSRWRALGYDSYTFVEQRLCFCGGGIEPATVVVRNGQLVSVTVVSTGEVVPAMFAQYFLTVEQLFDFILDAWDRDAFEVDVAYHPTLGYPTSIDIDYLENAIDEEMSYRASMLVPQR